MATLVISALYAGILGGIYALISLGVGLTRAGSGQLHGGKEGSTVFNRSRAQATVGEYAPIAILMLAFLEFNNVLSAKLLWWWGLVFTITRVLHSFQLASPNTRPSVMRTGSFLTMIGLLVTAAVLNVNYAVKHL